MLGATCLACIAGTPAEPSCASAGGHWDKDSPKTPSKAISVFFIRAPARVLKDVSRLIHLTAVSSHTLHAPACIDPWACRLRRRVLTPGKPRGGFHRCRIAHRGSGL